MSKVFEVLRFQLLALKCTDFAGQTYHSALQYPFHNLELFQIIL